MVCLRKIQMSHLNIKKQITVVALPNIGSIIQQLSDIVTYGGVVTRAMWKSINT